MNNQVSQSGSSTIPAEKPVTPRDLDVCGSKRTRVPIKGPIVEDINHAWPPMYYTTTTFLRVWYVRS